MMTEQLFSKEFIKRIQKGDPIAFEEMVAELSPSIYKLAYMMMGSEQDTKDVMQETFIKVFKSMTHFRGECSVRTWVSRIAVNTCKDMLRAQNRYQLLCTDDETLFLQIPDTAPSPEERAVTKEKREAVWEAVKTLPTEFKIVIVLCDLQGLSYIETAQALNLPLGTVKSRLNRARNLILKKLLQNRELFASQARQKDSKEAPKK